VAPAHLTTGLTVVATLGLLVAERNDWQRGIWVCKPLASAGFVATALVLGALEDRYGQALLVALALSLVADVLLISRSIAGLRAGLVASLLGHLGFLFAFAARPLDGPVVGVVAVAGTIAAGFVGYGLLRHVPETVRVPVVGYMVLIVAMLAMAAGTRVALVGLGAIGFCLAVLSVARDRFIEQRFKNRLWGLPLYYAAQLLMAWSAELP
jgi:uncharacterized membrane protein YhhN